MPHGASQGKRLLKMPFVAFLKPFLPCGLHVYGKLVTYSRLRTNAIRLFPEKTPKLQAESFNIQPPTENCSTTLSVPQTTASKRNWRFSSLWHAPGNLAEVYRRFRAVMMEVVSTSGIYTRQGAISRASYLHRVKLLNDWQVGEPRIYWIPETNSICLNTVS